jgi:hypothetical protein
VDDLRELKIPLINDLPNASISLSTHIMEGLIRIETGKRGPWKEEYDNKTFGQVVHVDRLKELFERRELDKIRGFNGFRVLGVHFKKVRTILSETQVGAE